MSGRVAGKVAFVTGAARGQGRSHAIRLAQEGADIIAVDICDDIESVPYRLSSRADLTQTIEEVESLGRRIVARQADVRDFSGLRTALDIGVAELGRLDIVSANAGIFSLAQSADLDEQSWRDMIDINLTGVWHTTKAATPHLISGGRGGSIILTGSTAAIRAVANASHYVAAKHGLVGLMRALALELAPYMIRVNLVHPTSVNTEMIHNDALYQVFRPDLESPSVEDVLETFVGANALPVPWVEPTDISNAVLFLASDEARYVTGLNLTVDAGFTLK